MKNTLVRPSGLLASAKLLIVGEQPIKQDVFDNKPFSGSVGQELDICLGSAGLNRNECYLTNVIKDVDRPLNVYFEELKQGARVVGLQPNEDAQTYVAELREELLKSPCTTILAIGNVALFALTSRYGINKWRGSILESTLVPGKFVVGCLDPDTVNMGQYFNRRLITFDIQRALNVSVNGFKPLQANIIIEPSYEDVLAYLTRIEQSPTSIIDYDLEVYNEEVSCISIAVSTSEVMSIPFVTNNADYFNPEQELEVWLRIARILEDPRREVRGQNLTFDSAFLFRRFGIKIPTSPAKIHDTMIAQKITMIDYPKGLDFITSIHTEIPYYKEDGKKWFKVGGSWPQLWNYNAMDSLACAQAMPSLHRNLLNQHNIQTYNRTRAVVGPLVYMMEHGIRVDFPGIMKKNEELLNEIEQTKEQLNQLAGTELNANSPKQLEEYFYEKLGFQRPKKKPTDEKAMKLLKIKGREEAELILKIRHLVKLRSTYLAAEKFDTEPDGTHRIRCSYDPCGTKFSRLSSSENIFGSGTNLQNWPHEIQRFLQADEGYVAYSLDLSQAENRQVAYLGNVTRMIQAFETGEDVHALTASYIFDASIEQIMEEDEKHIMCAIGDGKHTKRYWGKKANHSLNYDIGRDTFALDQEITKTQAAFIIDKYHKTAYPNVRNVYHNSVRQAINYNRTITNLMGRNSVFLGKICDALYKEAYACNPQGTVGDIINERGLNYVYYDQQNFANVELLCQTHDEIVFQIPLRLGWNEHLRILGLIKASLEQPLTLPNGQQFIIPSDVTMMKRFKVGKKVKVLSVAGLCETFKTLED